MSLQTLSTKALPSSLVPLLSLLSQPVLKMGFNTVNKQQKASAKHFNLLGSLCPHRASLHMFVALSGHGVILSHPHPLHTTISPKPWRCCSVGLAACSSAHQ